MKVKKSPIYGLVCIALLMLMIIDTPLRASHNLSSAATQPDLAPETTAASHDSVRGAEGVIVSKARSLIQEENSTLYLYSDYNFTEDLYEPIWVMADNVVIDGKGYTLQGGSGSGIFLYDRSGVTIKNVMIKGWSDGIQLWNSSNTNISGNIITDNSNYGIHLNGSSFNSISCNTITDNRGGIKSIPYYKTDKERFYSWNNSITANTISANSEHGIMGSVMLFTRITNNTITNNTDGLHLTQPSNENIISGNTISANTRHGIYLRGAYNSISGNTISANTGHGIIDDWGGYNNISENTITRNTGHGITFSGSIDRNTLFNNTITANSGHGITFLVSPSYDINWNTITGNNITGNSGHGIAFSFPGGHISRPTSIESNTITGNTITANSEHGIMLSGNYSPGCYIGRNTITANTITANNKRGIYLYLSSNNRISGNNITDNKEYGIFPQDSSNNVIYHNNLIDNVVQAYDTNPAANHWHHPDLLEGNYWSDYPGVDDGNGTGKHAIASDGIGDTDIPWPGIDYDYYPLMLPVLVMPVEIYSDYTLERDLKIISDGFIVKANKITLDLNGHTITGSGGGRGVIVEGRTGITVKNGTIENFEFGLYLEGSSDSVLIDNTAIDNKKYGIWLHYSSNTQISGNTLINNGLGIELNRCVDCSVVGNVFVNDGLIMTGNLAHFVHEIRDNLVNGKPLYYILSEDGYVVPSDAGSVIVVNSTNVEMLNLNVSNTAVGIELAYTNQSLIVNCITANNWYGIWLRSSSNNIITANTLTNTTCSGIYIAWSSNYNIITGNTLTKIADWGFYPSSGIYIAWSSNNNTIAGNTFTNNGIDNIYLNGSSHNTIAGNTFINNHGHSIFLGSSPNNHIAGNTLTNSYGIMLSRSHENYITGNTILTNWYGIELSRSHENYLAGNILTNSYFFLYHSNDNYLGGNTVTDLSYHSGFDLYMSAYNRIEGNTITNSDGGISLEDSANTNIVDNTIILLTPTDYGTTGIGLDRSANSRIAGNTITHGWRGIELYYSANSNIEGNIITNKYLSSISVTYSENTNIVDNTVTNTDRGITIGSSTNNRIEGNTVTNTSTHGIGLSRAAYISIAGNTITNASIYGIYLSESADNSITGNTITNTSNAGIYLYIRSNNNNISRNTISNTTNVGIWLYSNSNNNNISRNTISNTTNVGIWLEWSGNNVIYHNNIIDSGVPANDTYPAGNNWFHPGLKEGNYWSDYPGVDDGSGTGKHAIFGDGIGDTYIPWPGPDYDYYPFTMGVDKIGPDYAIFQKDISFEKDVGITIVNASVTNLGTYYPTDFVVRFFDEDESGNLTQLGNRTITNLGYYQSKTVSVMWLPIKFHTIIVSVDPDNEIEEIVETNNMARKGAGGNSPVVQDISSKFGVWEYSSGDSVGTFISGINVNNNFTANIYDLDGADDVVRVEFNLNNKKQYNASRRGDDPQSSLWDCIIDMVDLQTGTNTLMITAIDDNGLRSETKTVTIRAIGLPEWIKIDLPEWLIFWNDTDQRYSFEYFKPTSQESPLEYYKSAPGGTPGIGGKPCALDLRYGIHLSYYVNGKVEGRGGGGGEFTLLDRTFKLFIIFDIFFKPNMQFDNATISVTLGIPLFTLRGKFDFVIVKADFFFTIEASIGIILVIEEGIKTAIRLASLAIDFGIGCYGWLDAKIDIGIAMASLYASIYSNIHFAIGYNFDKKELFGCLYGSPGLGVNWRITWRVFIWKGEFKGGFRKNFNVCSPDEVNETFIEVEPWALYEDNTTLADSRPRVAADANGNAMMIWVHNRIEENNIYTDICYSNWEGTDWGPSGYVSYDKHYDFEPALTYDSNGNVIAVWSRILSNPTLYSPDDPMGILNNQEIVYSIWNGSTATWSTPQPITNDMCADGRAAVSASPDGKVIAVWVGDADSNFTTTTDMDLYYSVWNGTHWTVKTAFTSNTVMDYSVSLAHDSEGNATACWVRDLDGFLNTTSDRELRYARWNGTYWSSSSLITDLDETKDSPAVTFDQTDNVLVTWVGGDENLTRLYFIYQNKTTGLWSAPEIVHEDPFFIYYPAINVAPDNTAVIVWRGFEDDKEEQMYYITHNATKTYFDGEICYATKNLSQVDSRWSEVKFLTSDNKTDWMASAVIIRGHSNDLLLVWDQDGNVTDLVHPFYPDLTLESSDITFSNDYPTEGETIDITARIRNIGDVEASNIQIAFYDGDPHYGGVQINKTQVIEYLSYDSETYVTVSWNAQAGIHNIYIEIDPDYAISELNETNNLVYHTIRIVPDLSVSLTDISFSNNYPLEGESITINATIHNKGGTSANNIPVHFYSNYTQIGSYTISSLGVKDNTTVSMDWNVIAGFHNIAVVIDPEPDLTLDSSDIEFSNLYPEENETINITARIRNVGYVEAKDIQVDFYDGNPQVGGTLIATELIDYLPCNSEENISVTWTAELGIHYFYVVIDSLGVINEMNETNNLAYNTISILSDLVDISIPSPDISFLPNDLFAGDPIPEWTETNNIAVTSISILPDLNVTSLSLSDNEILVGKSVTITADIENLGAAKASDILVEFFDGNPYIIGTQIDNETIANIPIGKNYTSQIFWEPPPGIHQIFVIVDRQNRIAERNEINNALYDELVVRALADLSLSEADITIGVGSITINAIIKNIGAAGATGIIVNLYDGDPATDGILLNNQTILHIAAGGNGTASFRIYTPLKTEYLYFVVDPENAITESDETNNEVKTSVKPKDRAPPITTISLIGTLGLNGWYVSDVTVTLTATDDISGVAVTAYSLDRTTWITYTEPFNITIEGTTTVYYKSTDHAFNVETTKTATIKIDKTPPTTTISLADTLELDDKYLFNVFVTLMAIDATSGVAETAYSLDGTTWITYTESFNITTDETTTIYYNSTDIAGNVETTQIALIQIDKTAPETEIDVVGALGLEGWYLSNVTVTLTATDDISGVAVTAYSLDGTTWITYTEPFNITTEGITTVYYNSTDNLGHVEATQSEPIKIDQKPPTTMISLSDTLGLDGWYLSNVTVSLTATDATSGVAETAYSLDGATWITYTEPFNITTEGSATIYYNATDIAGNVEATKAAPIKIDQTPPTTTINLADTLGLDGWYLSNVTVTLMAIDAISGVAEIAYSFDESTWIIYTDPFTINTEGSTTVYYNATDAAGNVETTKTAPIKIDKTAPETTISLTGTPGLDGWYVSDVTITLTAINGFSGVAKTAYSLDGATWITYTGPFNITTEGTTTVSYNSTDVAGNMETTKMAQIKIDKTLPETTISLTGTPGLDGWYLSDVTITLTAINSFSGVAKTAYSFDGINWIIYTGPFNITTEGTIIIYYNSTDHAGNMETTQTAIIQIDKTPPTTDLTLGPHYIDEVGTIYVTAATEFMLTATDAISGVAQTSYRINGSAWIPYDGPFTLVGLDGTYYIDYNSTDIAGNMEPTTTAIVILDTTPPLTTLTIGDPKYVSDITYVTPETPFTLEADDELGSGVYSIAYRIYNSTYDSGWLLYTEPFYLTSLTDGVYSIEFTSIDNLGNMEVPQSLQVTLFSWHYVFTDSCGRGTTLKINTAHEFFQFLAPDEDYEIRKATYMRVREHYWVTTTRHHKRIIFTQKIIIFHKDSELRLNTLAIDTNLDFCVVKAWDVQTRTRYFLIDKMGIE